MSVGLIYQGKIQVRNGTAAAWTSANPILLNGEMGLETDTGKFKFGDGATAWTALAYSGGGTPPSAIAFNPQTASYVLVLADVSLTNPKMVQMNVGSANNLTVPPHSSVAAPLGVPVYITQEGAGQTTLVAGAGVTLLNASSLLLRAQNSTVALIQVATDTWLVMGDVA